MGIFRKYIYGSTDTNVFFGGVGFWVKCKMGFWKKSEKEDKEKIFCETLTYIHKIVSLSLFHKSSVGLYGLKHHEVEINGDVTLGHGRTDGHTCIR